MCIPNFTHTYTYAFCSADWPSQWSSKPPACQLLLPDELCSLNKQSAQGICKGFYHCISQKLSSILDDWYWKKCTYTNLEGRADWSLGAVSCTVLHKPLAIYLGEELLSHRLHHSKPESLALALSSHHGPSLDPSKSRHHRRLSRISVLEPAEVYSSTSLLKPRHDSLVSKIEYLCTQLKY